jgi:hypothetical protein
MRLAGFRNTEAMREIVLALPDGSSGDWLRGLGDYLGYESELCGRIRLMESEPVRGTLSSGIVEAVTVGLGSGGAITVLVSGAVSWLRQLAPQGQQPVPTELTMTLPNSGSVTVKTAVTRAWTQAELGEQIDRLVHQLSDADPADAG